MHYKQYTALSLNHTVRSHCWQASAKLSSIINASKQDTCDSACSFLYTKAETKAYKNASYCVSETHTTSVIAGEPDKRSTGQFALVPAVSDTRTNPKGCSAAPPFSLTHPHMRVFAALPQPRIHVLHPGKVLTPHMDSQWLFSRPVTRCIEQQRLHLVCV